MPAVVACGGRQRFRTVRPRFCQVGAPSQDRLVSQWPPATGGLVAHSAAVSSRRMTFHIGSVQGATVASIFFFVLISLPEAVGWFTKRRRPLVGGPASIVTFVLYATIWWWLWSGFYQVTVTDSTVELTRHFPSRVTAVSKTAVTGARWESGYKNTWALVVQTANGRHKSTRASVSDDERAAISAAVAR